jgi:hypothetical protein
MKIKCIPEGRKDIYVPDKESLKQWIKSKDFKQIHNFKTGGMMIGADHDVDSVLEDIDNSERLALVIGKQAGQNFGHSLAIVQNNRLELYDIGKITEDDLEITN